MERPILFSTLMIKAILTGEKTQTRRTIKPQPISEKFSALVGGYDNIPILARFWTPDKLGNNNPLIEDVKCPYGQIGDILWVRETWAKTGDNFHDDWLGHGVYYFKADNPFNEIKLHNEYPNMKGWPKWRPSIFMPKEACRIRLEITDRRAERLQDISEEDAIAEGVGYGFQMNAGWPDYEYIKNGVCAFTQDTAKMSFASLWDSINIKRASWKSNLWVWCICFKLVKL